MMATSSSVWSENSAPKVLNEIQDPGQCDFGDMFHSEGENYPWLAIDLGFLYKVFFLYIHIILTSLNPLLFMSLRIEP